MWAWLTGGTSTKKAQPAQTAPEPKTKAPATAPAPDVPPQDQEPTPREEEEQTIEDGGVVVGGKRRSLAVEQDFPLDCLQLSVSWLDRSNLGSFVSVCKSFRNSIRCDTRDLYGCRQLMFGTPRTIQELLMRKEAPPPFDQCGFKPFRMTEQFFLEEPTYRWEVDSGGYRSSDSNWYNDEQSSGYDEYEERLEEYNAAVQNHDHTFYSDGTYLRRDVYLSEPLYVAGRRNRRPITKGSKRKTEMTSTTGEIGIYQLEYLDELVTGRDGKKRKDVRVVLRTMACKIDHEEEDHDGAITVTRIARESSNVKYGEYPDSIRRDTKRMNNTWYHFVQIDLRHHYARASKELCASSKIVRAAAAAAERAGDAATKDLTHDESALISPGFKECPPAVKMVHLDEEEGDDQPSSDEEEEEEEDEEEEDEEDDFEDSVDEDQVPPSFGGRGRGGLGAGFRGGRGGRL